MHTQHLRNHRREAGAQPPAPSVPSMPDRRPVRRRARFSRFLPALALLFGAFSLVAVFPAQAAHQPEPHLPEPTNVQAWPTGTSGQIYVSWDRVSDADTYTIEYSHISGSSETSATVTAGNVSSYTLTGLTDGTDYGVRVRAVDSDNPANNSNWSRTDSSRSVASAVAPNQPRNVRVTSGDGKLTLTWQAPRNWRTWPPTGYTILWKLYTAGDSAWATATTENPSVTSFEFTGTHNDGGGNAHTVTNGTAYDLRIVATTSHPDPMAAATPLTSTPVTVFGQVPGIPPGRPTGLKVAAMSTTSIALSWTAPTGTVTGYDVHYTSDSRTFVDDNAPPGGSWIDANHPGDTVAYHEVKPLSTGTAYRFRVRAVNAGVRGPWAFATGTPVALVQPTNFTVTPGDGQLTLTWTAQAGAGPSLRHDVEYTSAAENDLSNDEPSSDLAKNVATHWVHTGSTSATSETITGLTNGTLYRVRLTPTRGTEHGPRVFGTGTPQAGTTPLPTVSLSASPNPVPEGDSVTVTATLSAALAGDVTIPLTLTDGTAESGDHGTLASITINAGATSGAGTITTVRDADNDAETFTVALDTAGLPSEVTAGSPSSVQVTISEGGDTPPPPPPPTTDTGGRGGGGTPAPSGDAALSALRVIGADNSVAALDPAFTPDTTDYSADVPHSVSAVTLTPTGRDSDARITVDGATLAHGEPGEPIALNVGRNLIELLVTAENGTTRTYTLTLTRAPAPAPVASLPELVVTGNDESPVTLSPAFDPGTPDYTANVAHTVTEVTLTPTANTSRARIAVAGAPVDSGAASAPVALKVGDNPVAITVTAADRSATRTYTVTLHRAAPVAVPAMETQQRVLPELARALADDTGDSLATRLETLRRPAIPGAVASATGTTAASAGAADAPGASAAATALTRLGQALAGVLPGSSSVTPPQDAFDPARADARVDSGWVTPAAQVNWKALLENADFVLPLRNTPDHGETPMGLDSLALWSDGSYKSLGGSDTGINWHGDILGARLGADMRLTESLSAGAAFSYQRAGWDVSDRTGDADRTLTLLSVTPYAGWTNQRLHAWASAGTGWGTLDSRRNEAVHRGTPDDRRDATTHSGAPDGRGDGITRSATPDRRGDAATHSEDITTRSLSGGLSGRLWDSAALRVQLKAEGLFTGMATESLTVNSHRLRVSMEADHTRRLSETATLTPALQLGLRKDGGAGRGGTGMELGGSLRYAGTSLTLYGQGRTLIGRDGYQEWGVQGLAEWRARLDGRGLFLRLSPGYGYAQSGIEQLWTQGLRQEAAAHVPRDYAARLDVNLSYAWDAPHHRGLITPTLEMRLQPHATAYRLGTRWEMPHNLQLRLLGERREGNTDTDHALLLESALRF